MILRPRTCCVYCGQRIPGALTRKERDNLRPAARERQRLPARVTCQEHRDMPHLDPYFDYWLSP